MKIRNKRIAAGILAAVFAVAMPASAFAAEGVVSGTDLPTADQIHDSFMDYANSFMDKMPSVDELKDKFTSTPDLDEMKDAFDSINGKFEIPNGDEIKNSIPDEFLTGSDKIKDVIDQIGNKLPGDDTTTDDTTSDDTVADDTTADDTVADDTTAENKIVWVDGIWDLNLEVHPGYNVVLPETLEVTYADGTKGHANVTWTETDNVSPVDATKHNTIFEGTDSEWGFFFIHAHVENYGTIVAVKVRITAKAPIPEEPKDDEPVAPVDPIVPEEPEEPEDPKDPIGPSEEIENVQTGENDLTMVWVLFMFSVSAMAVTFTSRKFRRA